MVKWVKVFAPSILGPTLSKNFESNSHKAIREKEARARLCRLKQKGSVRNYINEFTTLMLEISNMFDKDSLFYF